MLTYSVVICTLERRTDLTRCIVSWLAQEKLPQEIVVVHGGTSDTLKEYLETLFVGTGVETIYIRMSPSLVRQRNAGIERARGDIVIFADDDGEYSKRYAESLLQVYRSDASIGGVQGTIVNSEVALSARLGLANIFMLTRYNGNGTLQRSGWPAFRAECRKLERAEVFAGAAMSFRRDVLQEFRFDDALARYWVGDDFEMAYRVSRKYRLFQCPSARLIHLVSLVGRDGLRRHMRMMIVNHYYLITKCFGANIQSLFYWAWAELGLLLLAILWVFSGGGSARLLGIIDGYRELWDKMYG
jgi:GT2 family glycosyltransferase